MAGAVSLKRVVVGTLSAIGGLFVLLVIVAVAKQHDPYTPPAAKPVSPEVAAVAAAKQRDLEAKKAAAAAAAAAEAAAKKEVDEKQRQERRDFAARINKTTSFAAKTGGGDDRALIILVDHCTEANLAAMVRAMTAARLREVGFYFVRCTDPGDETHSREL